MTIRSIITAAIFTGSIVFASQASANSGVVNFPTLTWQEDMDTSTTAGTRAKFKR